MLAPPPMCSFIFVPSCDMYLLLLQAGAVEWGRHLAVWLEFYQTDPRGLALRGLPLRERQLSLSGEAFSLSNDWFRVPQLSAKSKNIFIWSSTDFSGSASGALNFLKPLTPPRVLKIQFKISWFRRKVVSGLVVLARDDGDTNMFLNTCLKTVTVLCLVWCICCLGFRTLFILFVIRS